MSKLTIITSRACAAVALGLAYPATAVADTLYTSLSAWEAAAGHWTETTNLNVADGTVVDSATLADGTRLSFGQPLEVFSIGHGWETWSHGYTGQVLTSYNEGALTKETWTVSGDKNFGLFIEPDQKDTVRITLTLGDGQRITQDVDGEAGAAFFGWIGSGITSLTINGKVDFAEGDFFSTRAPVPEPAALVLVGAGLACLRVMRRWRATSGNTKGQL